MIPKEVKEAQVIFVSHSGGKDSQAQLAMIHRLNLKAKIVIVHSDLGEMEWEPMHDFISKNSFGYEVHIIEPKKDFFEICRAKGRLPSGMAQFCTNELKTLPIGEFIRQYCAKHNITKAISAIGIRSQESARRAQMEPISKEWSSYTVGGWAKKRRELGYGNADDGQELLVTRWYPIFDYTIDEVWAEIKNAGQKPHHIYSKGFSRLSCAFCINGRAAEHKLAAEMKPKLLKKLVALEKELGKTYRLRQVKGQKVQIHLDEFCGA